MRKIDAEHERAEPPEMLSYREAARFLGVPLGTLYSLVHEERVPHVRMGGRLVRFRRIELERWVGEHTVRERQAPREVGRGHAS